MYKRQVQGFPAAQQHGESRDPGLAVVRDVADVVGVHDAGDEARNRQGGEKGPPVKEMCIRDSQYTVPGGCWFGATPAEGSDFALVGCTVAPGFDFADFEMADPDVLGQTFPHAARLVREFC